MTSAPPDWPPCLWCGGDVDAEITSSSAAEHERWFRCGHCNRIFCVVFVPDRPGDAIKKKK